VVEPGRTEPEPIEELTDRALRDRLRRAERTLAEAASADARELARWRKTESTLRKAEAAVRTRDEARAELARRAEQDERAERQTFRLRLRGLGHPRDRVKAGPHPGAAALRAVARLGHPELDGASLRAANLTTEEGAELAGLVKKMRNASEEREQLSATERGRYESLLGKAAGNANLFAKRRRDASNREKLDQLAKEARMAALALRPKHEQPGAVVLPAEVYEALKTSRDASCTIADVGMLAALRGMFANHDAALILGARFEKDSDGEDVLVTPEDLVFRSDSNPHLMQGGAGQVKPGVALATLARHKWIRAERRDGTFRIRLGEQLRPTR
jgi:hypothetical protein